MLLFFALSSLKYYYRNSSFSKPPFLISQQSIEGINYHSDTI